MNEFEQYAYVENPQPVRSNPSRGLCITSMALGSAAAVCTVVAVFFFLFVMGMTDGFSSRYVYRSLTVTMSPFNGVFSMLGLGLGIPAMILGIKGSASTVRPDCIFGKVGKITGLVSLIVASVCFMLTLITCATAM